MRRRKRKQRAKGYSDPVTKPLLDMWSDYLGVHGTEKRELLNSGAAWTACSVAIVSGIAGCHIAIEDGGVGIVSGWTVGLVVGAIAFTVAANWLSNNRFYRR